MPIRLNVVLCFYMRCRFSRAYLVGRACNRDYLLAAAAACRLRACASPTRTQTRAVSTPWGQGRRRRAVARPWPRCIGSVGRSKEHTRASGFGRKSYGLNCLVEGASEVTHHTIPCLAFFAFFLSPLARAPCILLSLALTCSAMRNACLACSLIAQNITSCRPK